MLRHVIDAALFAGPVSAGFRDSRCRWLDSNPGNGLEVWELADMVRVGVFLTRVNRLICFHNNCYTSYLSCLIKTVRVYVVIICFRYEWKFPVLKLRRGL